MPKPLVFLEQHLGADARNFIANNIESLKRVGYKTFLFEMDMTMPKEELKALCRRNIESPTIYAYSKESAEALLHLMETLEAHDFDYEFIDPESIPEAGRQDQLLRDAYIEGDDAYELALANRMVLNQSRDQLISDKIIEECVLKDGGVIYLGGFMHHQLIDSLSFARSDADGPYAASVDFCFLVLGNKAREEIMLADEQVILPDIGDWIDLSCAAGRANMYGDAVVEYFDMSDIDKDLSFELIQSMNKFYPSIPIIIDENAPIESVYFDKVLPGWQFTIGDNERVSASKLSDNCEEDFTVFTRILPGISFFGKKVDETHHMLYVPGLSLDSTKKKLDSAVFEMTMKSSLG